MLCAFMMDRSREKESEIHTVKQPSMSMCTYIHDLNLAQFKVHIRQSGKVCLQNMANPDNWLTIFKGRTLGSVSHLRNAQTISDGFFFT